MPAAETAVDTGAPSSRQPIGNVPSGSNAVRRNFSDATSASGQDGGTGSPCDRNRAMISARSVIVSPYARLETIARPPERKLVQRRLPTWYALCRRPGVLVELPAR
jgi:hypothetical protein